MRDAAARTVMRQAVLGQRRHLVPGTALLVLHQVCESLVPIVIGAVVDRAIGTGDTDVLVRWLVALGVLFAVLSFAWFTNAVSTERACQGAEHDARLRLVDRVLAPTGGGVERRFKVGKLVSIANTDTAEVGRLGDHVPGAIGAGAAVVVALGFLLAVDARLGLLILAGLPAVLAVEKLLADRLVDRWADEQEESSEAAAVATDLMAGLRVLKGLGAERAAAERYRRASQKSLGATLRAASAEAVANTAGMAVHGGFLALVALIAGRMAAGGTITIGEFVAVAGLTQFLIAPLETLGGTITSVAEVRASANRVAKVLETPAAVADGWRRLDALSGDNPEGPGVTGRLVLRGVSRGKLGHLDLAAGPGDMIGLAVPDPDVARELVACLAREADPAAGTIEIDGIPFEDLELDSLRRAVVVSTHDATLFEGTLADNVVPYGDGVIPLDSALEAAGAASVAESLPAGAATDLGQRGRFLSGGQAQRVALARALAVDAPVLVLHDPTTAVDSVTEQQVADGLARLRDGRTTLVITTSPALLAACTRVVFVGRKGSRLYGTHSRLVTEADDYRRAVLA